MQKGRDVPVPVHQTWQQEWRQIVGFSVPVMIILAVSFLYSKEMKSRRGVCPFSVKPRKVTPVAPDSGQLPAEESPDYPDITLPDEQSTPPGT